MPNLTAELNAFMDSLLERVDPATAALIARTQGADARLLDSQALDVGDVAPDFTLPDQDGAMVCLSDRLAQGPVVLIFVRGGWCPFCTLTLRAFDRIGRALHKAGGSLIAVAPTVPDQTRATAERHHLRFPLLSDDQLRVAETYGLVWEPDAELQATLLRMGHDVPRLNGTGDWRLPITAGYVIGPDRVIHTARRARNLTQRLEPAQALQAVADVSETV
jgi:peroxiredoxin